MVNRFEGMKNDILKIMKRTEDIQIEADVKRQENKKELEELKNKEVLEQYELDKVSSQLRDCNKISLGLNKQTGEGNMSNLLLPLFADMLSFVVNDGQEVKNKKKNNNKCSFENKNLIKDLMGHLRVRIKVKLDNGK
jgi:hypothetical protein